VLPHGARTPVANPAAVALIAASVLELEVVALLTVVEPEAPGRGDPPMIASVADSRPIADSKHPLRWTPRRATRLRGLLGKLQDTA